MKAAFLSIHVLGIICLSMPSNAYACDEEHGLTRCEESVKPSPRGATAAGPSDAKAEPTPVEAVTRNQEVINPKQGELRSDGWCLAKSQRGHFEVMLPGLFVERIATEKDTEGGFSIVYHEVGAEAGSGITFGAARHEFVGEKPNENDLQDLIDVLSGSNAVVTRSKLIIQGHPAVKVCITGDVADGEATSMEYISFVSADSRYILVVEANSPLTGDPQLRADINRFVESFRIGTPPAKSTQAP